MWKMPILTKPRTSSAKDPERTTGCYVLARPLPASYMSEFSVVGLLVDRLEEAVQVLGANHFSVHDATGDMEVAIDRPGNLQMIVRLLTENGIKCELADVVSGIYQG